MQFNPTKKYKISEEQNLKHVEGIPNIEKIIKNMRNKLWDKIRRDIDVEYRTHIKECIVIENQVITCTLSFDPLI